MRNITVQTALNDWENPLAELLAVCCIWYEHDMPKGFASKLSKDSIEGWLVDSSFAESKARKLGNLYKEVVRNFHDDMDTDEEEDQEIAIENLVDYIKDQGLKKIVNEPSIPDTVVKVIKDAVLYLRTDSEPAYNRVLGHLKSAPFWLNALIVGTKTLEVTVDKSVKNRLSDIVKERKGSGLTLTVEQKKKLMLDDPELNKEYNKLRLNLVNVAKNMLRKIVISQGDEDNLLPVNEAIEGLEKSGNLVLVPRGFDGYINSQGELFTTAKKKLAGNPGIAPITLNNSYDPETDETYVLEYSPLGGVSVQKIYTEDYKKQANSAKYDKVLKALKSIENSKSVWRKDMLVGIPEAFMVELLYITSARIGSKGSSTGGKATFGLTTLQRRHIKFNTSSVTLIYLGAKTKGEAKQKHLIKNGKDRHRKYVMETLATLHKQAPKPSSPIFIFHKGKVITAKEINKYIQRKVGDITAHKFRHIRGTTIAMELLKTVKRKPKNQKDAEDKFKKIMSKVGKELGHFSGDKVTPMTAITYYVLPEVSQEFFKAFGFRVPKFVPQ